MSDAQMSEHAILLAYGDKFKYYLSGIVVNPAGYDKGMPTGHDTEHLRDENFLGPGPPKTHNASF